MSEKRSFSRVKTVVPCRLRRVAPGDGMIFRDVILAGDAVDPGVLRTTGLPESVQMFLMKLDSKVDMLLSMASQGQLQQDFPIRGRIIDISGAGIRFVCDTELAVGEEVEVVMTLSSAPLQQSGAMGRVIRREPVNDKVLWVVEFTKIRERDQEAIVQFVFQEQRAQIREKKWS